VTVPVEAAVVPQLRYGLTFEEIDVSGIQIAKVGIGALTTKFNE